MDGLEKLKAIAAIRRLKARRVRCMDEKDWPGYAACHTPDAVSYTFQSQGWADKPITGARAIADSLKAILDGEIKKTTAHQIHEPEIDITSPTTARSIWPMEDMLWWEEDGVKKWRHGYGHYRQTYEKVGGEWLIKSRALTRIRVDDGAGDQVDVMTARGGSIAEALAKAR
ncbi:nuclear transport factor 2 family protein [Phenylobacterium sp.]|jgi:hypothetical protein|uniref:nuclear transport factor 2 family protein n=1 Tax=Phenylobacterium sp. TaxID=1871053 RepID=UPI002F422EC1